MDVVNKFSELPKKMQDKYQVGHIFSLHFQPGNINNKIFEIRAIVDDSWVVFRTYIKSKNTWVYQGQGVVWFQAFDEHINLITDSPDFVITELVSNLNE